MRDRSRRAVLGTTGVALATALAGCNDLLGGGGEDTATSTATPTEGEAGGDETPTETPTETGTETETVSTPPDDAEPEGGPAAVERWLTETTVGGEASNYDGDFTDLRGESSVEIAVGAEGNGGNFAFDPVAAVVSAGTEVTWQWTGEGGPHNVFADREAQINATDYEFRSGDPVEGEDVTYTETLDEAGIALYHCETHLSQGMKGGIVVEE